jgi:hypothetical protein
VTSFESFREQWQRQVLADSKLRPSYKLVCMAISLHFNRNENGAAWPGFETLAELTGQGRRTIIRATKEVERRGHLRINRARKDNGGSLSNRYFALLKDEGVVPQGHPGGGLGDTPGVAWVTPEPLSEPPNTAAGGNSLSDWTEEKKEDSRDRVLRALGTTPDDPKWTSQWHRLNKWVADGFDLDLDILPTISRLSDAARQRGKSISSLNYFNQAIAEAHAERIAPPTAITHTPRKSYGKSNLLDHINNSLRQSASDERTSSGLSEDPLRLLQSIRSRGPHDIQ